MYSYVDEIQHFNYKRDYLTLQRNYVFVVPLAPHLLCNDVLFAILFIVFPKMVDDPEVDEQFQKDEAMANYLWSISKSLVQEWIEFIHLKKSEMIIIDSL